MFLKEAATCKKVVKKETQTVAENCTPVHESLSDVTQHGRKNVILTLLVGGEKNKGVVAPFVL